MADSFDSVTRWIHELGAPESTLRAQAAGAIWQRYVSRLLAIVRGKLDAKTRRREDEEDVLQSVYASFCQRVQQGKFELASRDDLWRLLVAMSTFKSRRAIAKHRAQKRDTRLESAPPALPGDPAALSWGDLIGDDEPSPEECVSFQETVQQLLDKLDASCTQVVRLRLEGHTYTEIGELLGISEISVRRKIQRIEDTWYKALVDEVG